MHQLVLFFAVSLLSTAAPGPAVLYVSSQGVGGGMRSALAAGTGILAADAFYILLSITGLTTVLMASYALFSIIRWAGAVYLIYLGLRFLMAGVRPAPPRPTAQACASAPLRAIAGGFAVHAANPKALLYFGSLVPQFVDPRRPLGMQLLSLAIVHLLTASMVLLAYCLISARFRKSSAGPRVRRAFNLATGSMLVGAGVSMLAVRRAS